MGKKISYSSPLKVFWKDFYGTQKKITPNLTDEQVFSVLRNNLIKAPLSNGETLESRELLMSGLELWKTDSDGDLLHIFFLETQLRDFLEKTPLSDLDGLRTFLYENGSSKEVIYFRTKAISNCVQYNFGLHIPNETEGYAFSLGIYDDNSVELYFSHGNQNGRISDKFYTDVKKKKDIKSLSLAKYFRLSINTIAYMKCFPECVLDGVPKIVEDIHDVRSERNVNIKLAEKITDPETFGNSKLPHFRKGYFKMLRSDFYTNKKGQIIFVSETMVKGKAKTVSTSTQIQEFEKHAGKEKPEIQ